MEDIPSGSFIHLGGFGMAGVPENSLAIINQLKLKNLTLITNSCGVSDWGHGPLIRDGQIKKIYTSFIGGNGVLEKLYMSGGIEIELVPQGTLSEGMRASQNGIPAYYTLAGLNTVIQYGSFPVKLPSNGNAPILSIPKTTRIINGKEYMLVEALKADYALIKCYQADVMGNVRFRKVSRNFNQDAFGAATINIVEAEHIVDEIPADKIHMPGIFVDRVYKAEIFSKKIERLTLRSDKANDKPKNKREAMRNRIIERATQEIQDGMYINLGIGIPTMVANQVIGKKRVHIQGENGLVGIGPFPLKEEVDHDCINASKDTVTNTPGYSINRSSEAFGMMRGDHLHLTMLGGMQVSEKADLANWIIPGQKLTGCGGAMDLVSCGSKKIITMEHTSPDGTPKILKNCTLPLTGKGVVNMIITEKAVFEFTKDGLMLMEIGPDVTLEEIAKTTLANYKISPKLKKMDVTT